MKKRKKVIFEIKIFKFLKHFVLVLKKRRLLLSLKQNVSLNVTPSRHRSLVVEEKYPF